MSVENESQNIARQFEALCFEIFSLIGTTRLADQRAGEGHDFALDTPDGRGILIEAKVYRSRQVSDRWLVRIVEPLERTRLRLDASGAYLAVSSRIRTDAAEFITHAYPKVTLFGYDELSLLAKTSPRLHLAFEALSRRILDTSADTLPEPRKTTIPAVTFLVEPQSEQAEESGTVGADLCVALHQLPKGRAGFRSFENHCLRALQLLFADDFSYFRPQHRQSDKLRRDVVGKLKPQDDFWKSLVSDFRARYVVFEFKNYQAEITQAEVHSTEKYLYRTALRSVAVIIARTGGSASAENAARGALREAGKLILLLSLDDLCAMLHAFDRGDDPVTILTDKLDKMLMELGR